MNSPAVHVILEMPLCTVKPRKRFTFLQVQSLVQHYVERNLIINKSLYGWKTSAARFHEHLAESLLRLGFKKTKHDPDLWMIDKTSHYEHLATYVDDMLIILR
jgi:hypothetical protein